MWTAHRERETAEHPGRIELHLRIDEVTDAAEVQDLVESRRRLSGTHPHDRGIEIDVLASAQIRVEAGTSSRSAAMRPRVKDASARRRDDTRR